MYKRKMLTLYMSAVTALIFSAPLMAQSTTGDAETIEEIVVTGSRISRGNLTTPTPVTTISSENMELSGAANAAYLLREVPSMGLSANLPSGDKFGLQSTGLNTINLRNFGEQRT